MNVLSLIVLLPLLLGTTLCFCAGHSNSPGRRRLTAWIAAAVTGAALALLIGQAPAVFAGQTLLAQAGIPPTARAEEIDLERFCTLARALGAARSGASG